MWWSLREKLDPASGLKIALPPDEKLKADLASPAYEINARGVVVESKEHLLKRLGHSPDRGDAVVYATHV